MYDLSFNSNNFVQDISIKNKQTLKKIVICINTIEKADRRRGRLNASLFKLKNEKMLPLV